MLNAGYRPLLPAEVSGVVEPVLPAGSVGLGELFFSLVVVEEVSPEPPPVAEPLPALPEPPYAPDPLEPEPVVLPEPP